MNDNEYKGNGWSQYQKLVLNQLKDLADLLHQNSDKIDRIEKDLMLSNERRETLLNKVGDIERNVDHILYDERGINSRLKNIEISLLSEKESDTKIKALWGMIGGAVIIVFNLLISLGKIIYDIVVK